MAAVRVPRCQRQEDRALKGVLDLPGDLLRLREWLTECAVTEVTMEATGVYWRPVWHVLEDEGAFELRLVNAST